MPSMQLEALARCPDGEGVALGHARRFLLGRGYKAQASGDAGGIIQFRRGSLFGSLTGLNPRRWAALVTVRTAGADTFSVQFDINTTGQMVTDHEQAFWNGERSALLDAIEGRTVQNLEQRDARVQQLNSSIMRSVVIYSVAGGVGSAIIVFLLTRSGVHLTAGLAGLGAGVGATLGYQRGLQDAERGGSENS